MKVLALLFPVVCTVLATEVTTKAEQINRSDANQSIETSQNNPVDSDKTKTGADGSLIKQASEDSKEHASIARNADLDKDVLNTVIRELRRMKQSRQNNGRKNKQGIINERKHTRGDYDNDDWSQDRHDTIKRKYVKRPKRVRFVDKTIRSMSSDSFRIEDPKSEHYKDPGLELQALIAIYRANDNYENTDNFAPKVEYTPLLLFSRIHPLELY